MTRPGSRSASVSVVIPAYQAGATLPRVLGSLSPLPPDWELIVVDDHSTDDTGEVARRHGARVVVSRGLHSVSEARNTGIEHASGRYLILLDADVVAGLKTLRRALALLQETGSSCVFAVYDTGAHLEELVSRFKNHWIRVTTLAAPRPLDWINTSCAVMRRESLLAVGGFRGQFHLRSGGGDLDVGRGLSRLGPIRIDPGIEVAHLKRFTLASLLRNDFNRARGWLRLAWHRKGAMGVLRRPRYANVNVRFSLGVVLTVPMLAALFALPWFGWGLPVLLGLAALFLVLGAPFLLAARRDRVRGWPVFAVILWLDQLACAAGLLTETGARLLGRPHPLRTRVTATQDSPLSTARTRS